MKIAVIGAGAMGRGIAQVSAAGGHDVLVHDSHTEALETLLDDIAVGLEASVRRGKLSAAERVAALSRVGVAESMDEISNSDMVIEAIVERLDVKQQVFATIENIVSAACVLATNTSSLSIGAIASGMTNRDRLLGLHFFNPVQAMKLVEIVVRPETAEPLVSTAKSFVESINKTAVQVMDTPGFLVNLAGRAYVTEALAIVDENVASVDQVDRIARSVLGFPLGPFELMDLTGLDVNLPVTANVFDANFADPRLRSTWYHRYLFEVGLLGKKTRGGFYRYDEQPAEGPADSDSPQPALGTSVQINVHDASLAERFEAVGIPSRNLGKASLEVVSPLGLDVSTYCARHGLDPTRTVGIDTMFGDTENLTLMVPPGIAREQVNQLAGHLRAAFTVEIINDSPGFVAQRLVATVVNLACEIAKRGVAAPQDIDTAVRLGLRYPHGPLTWAEICGPAQIVDVLEGLHAVTGDSRYAPSTWLMRRVRAGLSVFEDDNIPARDRVLRPQATISL